MKLLVVLVALAGLALGAPKEDLAPEAEAAEPEPEAAAQEARTEDSQDPAIPPEDSASTMRIDCFQEPNANENACRARGCVWKPTTVAGAPFCFFDSAPANFAGYDVVKQETHINGLFIQLMRRSTPQIYQLPAGVLNVWVNYETYKQLSVVITNPERSDPIAQEARNISRLLKAQRRSRGVPRPNLTMLDAAQLQYSVKVQQSPFGLQIFRKGAATPFFDTTNIPGFSFEPQFQSITTRVVTPIYGFGEQTHPDLRHNMNWKKWSAFSRDQPVTGVTGLNLYGTHGFYMGVEASGAAHGVVLHNTHAQKMQLAPYPTVTYTTIGGDLEFQFFVGSSPVEVNSLYVSEIGLPVMPPYWSLGFHLCKYGYTGSDEVQRVIQRNRALGIPYDTQWVDIDYMYKRRDFTIDLQHFSALPSIANQLHSYNMKFVTILDPAIASQAQDYQPLTDGLAMVSLSSSSQSSVGKE